MAWTSLCDLDELTDGQAKQVDVDGFKLAVFLSGQTLSVMDNYCPHAGGNMSGGWVEDNCAVCPWHCWAFDLATGQLKGSPAVTIKVYPSRLLPREGRPTLVQADLPMY